MAASKRLQERRISHIGEILRSGKSILTKGKLHWIIFWPAMMWLIAAVIGAVFSEAVVPGRGAIVFMIMGLPL